MFGGEGGGNRNHLFRLSPKKIGTTGNFNCTACKESRVQQPGPGGFCYQASDFLTCLTGKCCFFGEIQITEGL